jgi:hypothetical protein
MWASDSLSFELVGDLTSDPVVTVIVQTPDGDLRFMAEIIIEGAVMTLRGFHVQGAAANAFGAGNLKVLARAVMERMNLDGLVVEGAPRTTGANPARRPGILRFSRDHRPSSAQRPNGP